MKSITEEAAVQSLNALAYYFAVTHKNDYDTLEELTDKTTEFAKSWLLRYCEAEGINAVQCDDDELDDETPEEEEPQDDDEERVSPFDSVSELLYYMLGY